MTTWAPTLEQAERAASLGAWFLQHVPAIFKFDESARTDCFRYHDPYLPQARGALLAALTAAFPEAVLQHAVADFLCFPLATALAFDEERDGERTRDQWWRSGVHVAAVEAARSYASEHPSPYVIRLVGARLEYMLMHVLDGTEQTHFFYGRLQYQYFPLRSLDCIELLLAWSEDAEARRILRDFIIGAWRMPVTIPAHGTVPPKLTHSYDIHRDFDRHFERFWPLLERDGHLDYPTFRAVVELLTPQSLMLSLPRLRNPATPEASALDEKLRQFGLRYLRELAGDLRNCTVPAWSPNHSHLCGLEWLLRACDHVEREHLAVLTGTYGDPQWMIRSLANISGLDDGETVEQAVAALRAYSRSTLKALLPHTRFVSSLVLEALGWNALIPLDRWLRDLAGRVHEFRDDVPNCADPEVGVIDREELLDVIALAGEPLVREYVDLLTASEVRLVHTLTLVQAVLGWNAESIVDGLNRDRQIAIKAFGLVPLTGGEDEILERYKTFKDIDRVARAYGPERVLNTRAAVAVGLANLAATAGYADRVRMEWALEARLSGAARSLTAPRRIGDWEVQLLLGDAPRIVVRKGGRELKSVPPAVRRHDDYVELKDALGEMQSQAKRVRASLESLMANGETLTAADFAQLARMPAAASVLTTLVLRDANGRYGLYCADDGTLQGLDGERVAPAAPMVIAHPCHFAADGCFITWQREIVRRRIVQPFKQVFRELYVPLPDERERAYTARFAGHRVDSKKATWLLGARRWQVRSSDIPEPQKWFPAERIRARLSFPDAQHYLASILIVTADRVTFAKGNQPLPLAQVPPAIFSEVLRDVDLVVSAAAATTDGAWSEALAEYRSHVVRAMVAEFGVANVEFHDRHAHVKGTRANYRIHLGSGVVHLDPGAQVCPIPPSTDPKKMVSFLPFPSDEDVKSAEIIGLILLFANDDKITDPALLAQIDPNGA